MKTSQFTFNMGVNTGYVHNNELTNKIAINIAKEKWQKLVENYLSSKNMVVGANFLLCSTVYHKSHGCPLLGEDSILVTGIRNPEFNPSDELWREVVQSMCIDLAKEFKQVTGYLSFSEVDFHYLKPIYN